MDRFYDKTEPEPNSGCLLWTASCKRDGYGQFKIDGAMRKAHRVAWALERGATGNLHVLHKCDNALCVNVDHLYLGTHSDNMRDMNDRTGNPATKHCSGESSWCASLSNEQAEEIRRRYVRGVTRQQDLADEYGVAQTAISRIVLRKSYK